MREFYTEALVVGAGPVGLTAGLLLAKAGIDTRVVDREHQTASRSYACALHPSALALLDRLGVAAELIQYGRKLESIAFFEGTEQRAELKMSQVSKEYPFLLVIAQSVLESRLEKALRDAGVGVAWNHRLDAIQTTADGVDAVLEELGGTAVGYIVPHWEQVVKRPLLVRSRFVIGADGAHSTVRQRLGITSARVAGPDFFAAYEFESDSPGSDQLRVVMDDHTINVLWPLAGNRRRWTFQMVRSEMDTDFPRKERRPVRISDLGVDEKIRAYVERIARKRAPWFKDPVKEITWCTDVVFEQRFANEFGRNGCWLVGDAGHQTGPAGAQSMNVGFLEAEALTTSIRRVLREGGSPSEFEDYDRARMAEWRELVGMTGGLKAGPKANAWAAAHAQRLLPCLPGSGKDLRLLAGQLGLELPARTETAVPAAK